MAYERYDRDERSRWSDERDRNWRGETAASISAAAATSAASGTGRATKWPPGSATMTPSGGATRTSAATSAWATRPRRPRRRPRLWTRHDRDRSFFGGGRSDRDFNYDRGVFNRGGSSDRDWERDRGADRQRERGYRPRAGAIAR